MEEYDSWLLHARRKRNKELVETGYWIDRRGKTHRYKGSLDNDYIVSIHAEIAKSLYPDSLWPGDILSNLGWVMVGSLVYNHPVIYKEPSQSQINKLDELGIYDKLIIINK